MSCICFCYYSVAFHLFTLLLPSECVCVCMDTVILATVMQSNRSGHNVKRILANSSSSTFDFGFEWSFVLFVCFFIIFEFDFDFAASAFVALVSCASAVAVSLCLLLTVAADDAFWILNFAHSSLKAQRFGVVRTFGAAMLEYLARYKIKLFARFF